MDHAIAGAQRNATTGGNELRQGVMRLHIHRLGVGGGVAETLHHQIRAETEAGQVFQLVAGHRASGVLAAHRSHLRFAIGARAHALAFCQTTGAAHHFLRQAEALAGIWWVDRQPEQIRHRQAQRFTRLGGQAAADD